MKIPKTVKIGAITYKVIIADDWLGSDGADGECIVSRDRGGPCIYVRADLVQEAQEITFMHEALHAMNSTMDHQFLDSLSEQIYQFLKDNHLIL
jgi:hypothetical protein